MNNRRQSFADKLAAAVRRCGNPVLVGLDPRAEKLPSGMLGIGDLQNRRAIAQAYRTFCREIIDVVSPLVPAVKPQAAFFEQLGPTGLEALADVVNYAHNAGLIVILDAKRGDIGSTAAAYADGYLGAEGSSWGADALTVNPYLGDDSLTPFVQVAAERGAGVFVLVKTSNPGGKLFQDLVADGQPVYRHVARHVATLTADTLGDCGYSSIGAVVGATYPEQLGELRQVMPQNWFLVPGYGSQGATARDVGAAFDAEGLGAVINSSRAVIFAHARPGYRERFGDRAWQRAVEAATREMINQLRAETAASQLGEL